MPNQDFKSLVKEQFGRNAEKYVRSATHAQGRDLVQFIEWLQPQASQIALDVATGGGHTAKALAPHVKRVFATDLTPTMLATARQPLTASGCDNVYYVAASTPPFTYGWCGASVSTSIVRYFGPAACHSRASSSAAAASHAVIRSACSASSRVCSACRRCPAS